MKSQRFLRRSTTLVKTVYSHCPLISPSSALRYPGWNFQLGEPTRNSSSTPPNSSWDPSNTPPPPLQNPNEEALPQEAVEVEKPKRKTRASAQKDSETPPQLPASLNILWTPQGDQPKSSTLPPPGLFEELLDNLHVTLHPQTQHKATYSSSGPRIEPTFALYCPIEGGDYIIDETVRELARRTGSDVVVIDAVQLAAGESGAFGKAATALQLPENPLHFPASSKSSRTFSNNSYDEDEDEFYDYDRSLSPPSQMTVHLLASPNSRSRTVSLSSSSKSPSKAKAFFDEIVNIPAELGGSAVIHRKPRLIYIRDYLTLAASSSIWYPALLAAVRQRRAGPIARTSSPIPNPMTIVFGMTPSLTPSAPSPRSRGGPRQSLMNLLMNRQGESTGSSGGKVENLEWNEDELSDKARERRLRERLRKWESEDSRMVDDLPGLMGGESSEEYLGTGQDGQPKTILIGPQSLNVPLPTLLNHILARRVGSPPPESQPETKFYRTSVLVPSVRSQPLERSCRVERRKEINELTMRMAISSIGGLLPLRMPVDAVERNIGAHAPVYESIPEEKKTWEDWGKQILAWTVVREIADRAVGSVLESRIREINGNPKFSLDPTPVPWSAVIHAWTVHRSVKDIKKSWLNSYIDKTVHEDSTNDHGSVDEIIERIKESSDLTDHEQRLLTCIVDPRSLTSTFEHVHLPPHTVDSVRTIVSLPLLYPEAFEHGILKEYGITGCLLFGPPGTGKTLIVRALAKEADCRMLSIAPSDVMDMYVGEGEKLVKAVFSLARRLSPCVVFIDELDALLGARIGREAGAFSYRGVITEFMSEMDGLKSSKEDRVIVIGATNRPFDLDDAVLRRLPRRLLVDLPGENEREEILKIMLRNEQLAPDVDVKALAKKTESFSGSDLKNLCVSAAMDAVKVDVVLPWSQKPKEVTPPEDATAVPLEPSVELDTEIPTSSVTDSQSAHPSESNDPTPEVETVAPVRVLTLANFTKAMKEITPSSSEALGSLGELRKWNDEFGEGRKEKRRQMWGKGNFGFIEKDGKARELKIGAEGDVPLASNVSGSNP